MTGPHTPARHDDFASLDVGLDRRTLHLDRPIEATDHVRGQLDATVQLVEYGDYQCPFCAQAWPGVADIVSRFADRVVFAFRHFPLVSQHPDAWDAAIAAEAAGRQHRFWEMHKHLLTHQRALKQDELFGYARALGLDLEKFERDFHDSTLAEKVRRDTVSGLHSGVTGTPTFFVQGRRLEGGFREKELLAAIDAAFSRER
jgi:protein-disulfide isomerase